MASNFPSVEWFKDAVTTVVVYGLLAAAAAFTADHTISEENLRAVWTAGYLAAFAALKTVVAGLVNGTNNLFQNRTGRT